MSEDSSADELIAKAWRAAYLDAHQARSLGQRVVVLATSPAHDAQRAFGCLHIALAEVRIGDLATAESALTQARAVFEKLKLARGLALADEVQAIALRRVGDFNASAALQAAIDDRGDNDYSDHDRFIAHNSRAITAKHQGRNDDALRHFYRALAAARRTPWAGPEILALGNLGGFHQDLYNLEDARTLSERALSLARAAQARQMVATAAANLITIYHALAQPKLAHAMADFLLKHEDELPPGALQQLSVSIALGLYCGGELDAAQAYLDRGAVGAVADGDGRAFWAWLQARCALTRGRDSDAWRIAQQTLVDCEAGRVGAQPYDLLQLYRVASEASEQAGDLRTALAYTRRAQAAYEDLVGRSASARFIALEITQLLDDARLERDQAVLSRQSAEDDRQRLAELNTQLQAQMAATEALQTQLREQALRDPLTGLHNRRYLFEVAPRLLDLAQRQSSPLCVVLIDLDRFKAVNDQWGHATGDRVLRAFAALLTHSLRRSDVLCRHGGEEFVIVMPDIGLDSATAMLRRLLQSTEQMADATPDEPLPTVTFSAGVAVFPRHGDKLDQLLSRADRALYKAKDNGRARIVVAQVTGNATLS